MSGHDRPLLIATSDEFRHLILEAEIPVLVEFTAAWCAPCRALAPVLEELAGRHAGHVRVAVVDVERAPELAQAYRVTGMPTLLGLRGGDVVLHQVGFSGRRPLERLFEQLAALPPGPAAPPPSSALRP